jgi:hypothetical protein
VTVVAMANTRAIATMWSSLFIGNPPALTEVTCAPLIARKL